MTASFSFGVRPRPLGGAPLNLVPRSRVGLPDKPPPKKESTPEEKAALQAGIDAALVNLAREREERVRREAENRARIVRRDVAEVADLVAGVKLSEVLKIIATVSGVKPRLLASGQRTPAIARPRMVLYWLARRFTLKSLPEIGLSIGGRDHTTVLHGARRVDLLVNTLTEPADDTPEAWARLLLAVPFDEWPPMPSHWPPQRQRRRPVSDAISLAAGDRED